MTNLTLLPEDIRSEFTINEQGRAFASRRAIARLCDVDVMNIIRAIREIETAEQKLSKLAETIATTGFKGAELVPDYVASEIVGYYAMDAGRYCTEQAKRVYKAFAAVGFRAWVQSELGWQKPQPQPAVLPIQPDMTLVMLNQAIQGLAGLANHVHNQHLLIQQQQEQINQLLTTQQQAEAELKALPMADTPAPEKPTRAKINEIVRNYVQRNNISHQSAWNKLYKELYYRCHIDVDARCKNRKSAKLDIVEEAGYMEQLHAIASEVLC